MLQHELEELLGYKLLPWMWEMANAVYMEHKAIEDERGKDQIARIIRLGGWAPGSSPIREMYKEIGDKPIAVETKKNLYETYSVSHNGYCFDEKPALLYDVFVEVKARLEKEHPELIRNMDYFEYDGPDQGLEREKTVQWNPETGWIIVHYVQGGSEGFYVHVAIIKNGKYTIIFLAKTLLEGEDGRFWSGKMVAALSRIMEV